jgi:hypothetical protein
MDRILVEIVLWGFLVWLIACAVRLAWESWRWR